MSSAVWADFPLACPVCLSHHEFMIMDYVFDKDWFLCERCESAVTGEVCWATFFA